MSKTKKILFLHQNFPGQYKHLAPALAAEKNIECISISQNPSGLESIKHYQYKINEGNIPNVNRLVTEFETKMIRATCVAKLCIEIKEEGFDPDLIIAHPGWGEGFLLKDIWSNAKFLNYFEFYYNSKDSDVDFDLEESQRPSFDFDLKSKLTARNSPMISSFVQADKLICPTDYQKSTSPVDFKDKIKVIHEGINTDTVKPIENASLILQSKDGNRKETVTKENKVITFLNRNLEPYRGYHIFMRSLPEVIEKHPDAYILIIGDDGVSYGATPKNGSYKDIYFNEIKDKIPNNHNIRFLGRVPYEVMLNVFSISTAHVYLTYPFVLSWSMLEAMACEVLILGSKTPPIEEVIKDKKNGMLFDFHNPKELSELIDNVLQNPKDFKNIRNAARKTIIENYEVKKCLPKQVQLVKELLK